jgi:hypothetical protein
VTRPIPTFGPGWQPPETRLLLFPRSGLLVDSSSFAESHVDGETPTSLGVPALRLRRVEAVIDDALERAWERCESKMVDGNVRLVGVVRDGAACLVPLEDLRFVEVASILSEVA